MAADEVRCALLGAGTVGTQVARLLGEHRADLAARAGAPLRLVSVLVTDRERPRPHLAAALAGLAGTPAAEGAIVTDRPEDVWRSAPDVVIEVMGGIEPARTLLLAAMAQGAAVVTANKALLAADGATLHAAAAAAGVDLYFEASVAGAIPLLRPLRESLAGDRVRRVMGIVNGTTNYILTRMTQGGLDFATALAAAQRLGYAEADPSADVDGLDAAAKAAILAQLAFHTRVTLADVSVVGITGVTATDIANARDLGLVVKLLAIAERVGGDEEEQDGVIVRVHPTLLPASHPLANVHDAFNAVFIEAEAAGDLMFYGRGAGGAPTASAVLGDIVAVARNRVRGTTGPGESTYADLPVLPIDRARTRYQLALDVLDRPGVLAAVAAVFAAHGVSIEVVRQDALPEPGPAVAEARLIVRTHTARESALAATVAELAGLPTVDRVVSVMRVAGGAEHR
ncbi:MAG: homoserine dehydrogenase [Actinomycetales bacterium]|nr:homoserine dehydrogenase [Actinomycetales bacterium]